MFFKIDISVSVRFWANFWSVPGHIRSDPGPLPVEDIGVWTGVRNYTVLNVQLSLYNIDHTLNHFNSLSKIDLNGL